MSKTKVIYKSEKFFVNKQKRTVACSIEFEINLLEIEAVQRMLTFPQFAEFLNESKINWDYDEENFGVCKFKVSGKAKAADVDEFDENFGKRLAKTRAQEKAFIAANEFYCKVGDFIHKLVLKDFENLISGTENAFWKCVNHKNELINEKFNLNG